MPYELIITEKPSAANKIAFALADGKPVKENYKSVPYYKIRCSRSDIVVGCAVGHLFTLAEKGGSKWTYPVFDVAWEQSSNVSKAAAFSSKYVSALSYLAKGASVFTVATDYDIEGEVIGYNIVRFIAKKKDARRMKFSTLTTDELRQSYSNASQTLDWGQVNAGLTRHELDWYYGINLSRALTLSMKKAGNFKVLSSGRVQGPALKIIVDREREIQAFKPEPYWMIRLLWFRTAGKDAGAADSGAAGVEAWHRDDKIFDEKKAKAIFERVKGEKKAAVSSVEKKEFSQMPPFPFDLTTLQTEAYRCFRIQPKETLSIAQNLYLAGLISYPRTSSQQLPPSIGYKKILSGLSRSEHYAKLAQRLVQKQALKPHNGGKTDPAHPAIFPTGNQARLKNREEKIYDLVVKRFMAAFCGPAKREAVSVFIDVKGEVFVSKGARTIERGWHDFYSPYVSVEEQTLPFVSEKEQVSVKNIENIQKETQPPKRYTPASIIRELEKKNLGTKSTRASIVDTLFQRGYVIGQPIGATQLGIQTISTLERYCPTIVDEELTRHFEEEMELVRQDRKKSSDVLKEAKSVLTKILERFRQKEAEIGKGMSEAYKNVQAIASTIGPCKACGKGTLVIKKGRFGRFIACDKYPACTATYHLSARGDIKPTGRVCGHCSMPVIKIISGKKAREVCINPDCKGKQQLTKDQEKEIAQKKRKCPKCGKDMVLRRSVYGQFFGCGGYPKCRHVEKIS